MSSSSNIYALVTGASNGIGRAMAEECAKRGYNVLLVALPEPILDEATAQIKKDHSNQSFDSLGVNLMEKDAPKQIFDWCVKHDYQVSLLINNAGLGNSGPFTSLPAAFYFGQLQLNIVSLVILTHHFIPMLEKHKEAHVLNVASMAGFYDIPFKGIYSASKKFVLSFSRSLNKELENTSVNVTALCPGGVLTNEDVKLRTQELGFVARKSALLPEEVASYTLSKMFRGKRVIIPGKLSKTLKFVSSMIPYKIRMNMMANQFIKNSR